MMKTNKRIDNNSVSNDVRIYYLKRMWTAAGAIVLLAVLFFVFLSFQDLPDFEQLENPDFELASVILDNSGQEVGRYYTQNRVPVSYKELNPYLLEALIATEDERFYSHAGVDVQALGRVALGLLTLNPNKGGGSTITQQLAKLLFDRPDFSEMGRVRKYYTLFITKLKEWITAAKLEKSYTKEEILAMYLNKVEFIYGAYGIRAASEIYFGKPQNDLEIEEAATLIGMLKNPALFNPVRRPDTVLFRRMVVLHQMERNNYISEAAYDSIRQLPLDMSRFKRQSHTEGPAPYFRMELAKWLKNLLNSEEYRKPNGDKYNIYRDGLKIYTTIDLEMQKIAEEEMFKHMETVQSKFWGVWRNRDPWSHQADNFQREIRKTSLENLIRFSDRYQNIRTKLLDDMLLAIEDKAGISLSDWDIENLMKEDERNGRIAQLVANTQISSRKAGMYRKVLSMEEWQALMAKWPAFQDSVDVSFNRKVSMNVFAYNDEGEKEVIMTPMDSIKYHRQFLQTGILAIDPKTGYIKTWVGGINHKYFQYDHIHSSRQVGSTFKPFVYSTAIALQGFSPCFPVVDEPYTIAPGDGQFGLMEPWTPRNADGVYTRETLTLYECLRKSKNTCSVFLMQQLGNANVVRGLIHNMGIDSTIVRSDGEYRVPNQPSICLGSADLSVMEMTGAYATFANNGLYNKPIFVTSIEDENGSVIFKAVPEEHIALPPHANFVMVDMLKQASVGFYHLKSEVGGKTGTTNDYVDGWFIGITPSLVVGTWVGGEDPWIRFLSLTNGQGSRMAKPFFKNFLERLEESQDVDYDPSERFYRPPGDLGIEIDCNKYRQFSRQTNVDQFEEPENFVEEFDFQEF